MRTKVSRLAYEPIFPFPTCVSIKDTLSDFLMVYHRHMGHGPKFITYICTLQIQTPKIYCPARQETLFADWPTGL